MARRTKSSFRPIWIVVAILLVGAAFLGSQFFLQVAGEQFRTTASLDVHAYLENANSLRGNTYKIEGEIVESLAYSPSSGRLFAVGVDKGKDVIPVLVPADLNEINIQKGQKFIFLLDVDDDGILRVRKLVKA